MLPEPMQDMFSKSQILILDFAKIPKTTPNELDIREYFEACAKRGENARQPENRQRFNNAALVKTNARYLVGQYAEDRIAMLADTPAGHEGRTYHMGVDVFAAGQEAVMAPCDGKVVRSDYEPGYGEYGNYLIMQPENSDYYIFFGHLANGRVGVGPVQSGQVVGHLGDYKDNENGGWSRHLHIQILRKLPAEGQTPLGYSTKADLAKNKALFPNPQGYFRDWQIASQS